MSIDNPNTKKMITRRQFIAGLGVLTLGAAAGCASTAQADKQPKEQPPTQVPTEIITAESTEQFGPEKFVQKIPLPYNFRDRTVQFYERIGDKNGNFVAGSNFHSVTNDDNKSLEEMTAPGGDFDPAMGTMWVTLGDTIKGRPFNYNNIYIDSHSGEWAGKKLANEPLRAIIEKRGKVDILYYYDHDSELSDAQKKQIEDTIQIRMQDLIGYQIRIDQPNGNQTIRNTFDVIAISHIPHESQNLFYAVTSNVLDVAQHFDLVQPEAWEEAKLPNVPQYIIMSFCGRGPNKDEEWQSYSVYALLLKLNTQEG